MSLAIVPFDNLSNAKHFTAERASKLGSRSLQSRASAMRSARLLPVARDPGTDTSASALVRDRPALADAGVRTVAVRAASCAICDSARDGG